MEEIETEGPGRSTGPRSPDGKANSSKNSLQHGCRAKTVILPGEKQADFDALCNRWWAEFDCEEDADLHFVEQIVINDWFLQRTLRRYNAVEAELANFAYTNWTDEQHKKMQLTLRYKGEAERALNRAIRAADTWRKNRSQETRQIEHDCQRAQEKLHAAERKLVRFAASLDRRTQAAIEKYGPDVFVDVFKDLDFVRDKFVRDKKDENPPYIPEPSSQN